MIQIRKDKNIKQLVFESNPNIKQEYAYSNPNIKQEYAYSIEELAFVENNIVKIKNGLEDLGVKKLR